MTELHDTDVRTLDARIEEAVQSASGECIVQRFTLWFTGREPVHGARVLYATNARG